MVTQIITAYNNSPSAVTAAAALLRAGECVAFPTETVYGLGANGLDEGAVAKIFAAKGRPNDNPLILHIHDFAQAEQLWTDIPETAKQLAAVFWPGPLTLIYTAAPCVPAIVRANLPTVALRMPDNEIALHMLRAAGLPIAAPSANSSGSPSPTSAAHVMDDLNGRIPLILDGGACHIGIESTILSLCTAPPTLLRPGAITREMIEAVIGEIGLSPALLSPLQQGETPQSPGQKHRHYAPNCKVKVISGEPSAVAARICELYEQSGQRCHIAATAENAPHYTGKQYTTLGSRGNPATLCANLFSLLRAADCDLLLMEGIDTSGAGLAYMNRVLRAAGFDGERV
ncbi:MAG: L-threonylcarbamoyladenylate synthase [Clostridiales bacterium]|nr:L-threonylcarbamoyladenylate synthase [Clostridiales bacterium]